MSAPHCRRKHIHKQKPSPLMQSVKELKDALDRFLASKETDLLAYAERSLGWRVHRPNMLLTMSKQEHERLNQLEKDFDGNVYLGIKEK